MQVYGDMIPVSSESQKQPCIVCKEPINSGARKCIHCNSFQDWRKHVTGSHLVLSLIVALISVLSLGVPVIIEALKSEDSEIKISLTYARESMATYNGKGMRTFEIGFYAVNKGNRPAALKNASIKSSNLSSNWKNAVLYPGSDGKSSMVVQAGEARLLRAHLFEDVEKIAKGPFVFRVDVVNFSSGEKPVVIHGEPMAGGWIGN